MEYSAADYQNYLLKGLHSILISRDFVDIRLSVEDRTFFGHRNVLAAASPYFYTMFTSELSEKEQECITLHGVKADTFDILMEFMYTGKLRVTEENCQDLMSAADLFRLSDILQACCSFLEKQLDTSNCIGIHQFADSHGCRELANTSESYIHDHFIDVTKDDEYLEMSKENLVALLQSEHLHVESEYQVFVSAMRWVLHDIPVRRKLVFAVLSPVRFPVVNQRKLERYIEECGDLSLKIALRKLVQDYKFESRMPLEQKLSRMKPFLFQPRKNSLKSIYVIGGYSREVGGRWSDSMSLVTVESFNTFHQQWRAMPPLHHPRSGHGCCVLNSNVVYVIGGESDSLIFDNAERYDPSSDKWTMIPSMTVPRCGLGVCAVDNVIYAIGGWVGSEIGNTIEKYDPIVNCWCQWDKIPTLRFAMGVIAVEGLVYILGGMSDLGTEMRTVESYNPVTREWMKLADMLTHRAYVGLAYLDNCIYTVGGWNDDDGALASVEKYSLDEEKWSSVPPMTMRRAGATVTAVNGLLYAIGGRLSDDELRGSAPCTTATVECYDPQINCWMMISPMPTSRCEAAVAIL